MFKAEKKVLLDANGEIVEEGSPYAAHVLVNEGDEMPNEEARALGLIEPLKSGPQLENPAAARLAKLFPTTEYVPAGSVSEEAEEAAEAGDGLGMPDPNPQPLAVEAEAVATEPQNPTEGKTNGKAKK